MFLKSLTVSQVEKFHIVARSARKKVDISKNSAPIGLYKSAFLSIFENYSFSNWRFNFNLVPLD